MTPVTTSLTTTAAEQAAVDRVHRYYELVDHGDVAGLVGLFAPGATYHRPGYPPIVGHEAMTSFYRGTRVIREGNHTISRVVAGGTGVAVHGTFAGVLHDGKAVSLRFSDFFELASDGRFARRDTFFFTPLV